MIAHLKSNDNYADVFPNSFFNLLFNLAEYFGMLLYLLETIYMVLGTELINDEYTHYFISNENLLVCSKKVTQIGVYISMEHLI